MQRTSAPNIAGAPLPQRARSYWKARFAGFHGELEKLLEAERAQLPPWFVVGFGTGIAAWFAFNAPSQWLSFLCLAAGTSLGCFVLGTGRAGRAVGWFALATFLGCALIWMRALWAEQPRLRHPIVTEVTGRVESVDHLAARETVRLMIAPSDGQLPPHVRVSIDEDKFPAGIAPGAQVSLRARLAPPPPMALPGTYDFARDAWFRGIGAVGKAMGDVAVEKAATPTGLDRIRTELREHITTAFEVTWRISRTCT